MAHKRWKRVPFAYLILNWLELCWKDTTEIIIGHQHDYFYCVHQNFNYEKLLNPFNESWLYAAVLTSSVQ